MKTRHVQAPKIRRLQMCNPFPACVRRGFTQADGVLGGSAAAANWQPIGWISIAQRACAVPIAEHPYGKVEARTQEIKNISVLVSVTVKWTLVQIYGGFGKSAFLIQKLFAF